MAFAQAAARRPIEGAVATLGVSDRLSFLRKTYAHLGASLIAFAAVTGLLFKFAPAFTWKMATIAGSSMGAMLGLVVVLVFAMYGAEWLARHSTSVGLQYAGLGLGIALQIFMLLPLIWVLMFKFNHYSQREMLAVTQGLITPTLSATAASVLLQATAITLAIFIGLTAVVFVTKKDFTFMRGALVTATFGAMGVILASIIFGFSLGAVFAGLIVLLMAGYILYETSLLMNYYPPTAHVAAALSLFVVVATMFRFVLRILISLRSD
jgi:FtsH-binding integral membrane protein